MEFKKGKCKEYCVQLWVSQYKRERDKELLESPVQEYRKGGCHEDGTRLFLPWCSVAG